MNGHLGEAYQPTALCIWHRSLSVSQDLILYEDNIRQRASKLYRVVTDRSKPRGDRKGAQDQAKRAEKFDSLLQKAFRKSEPVQ